MEHFRKSHFGTDVSSWEHFDMCRNVQVLMDVSTRERFDMGSFRHEEFSASGIFGTGTFQHGDISAQGHFGTVAQVPKYPCVEMFLCQKFLVPKITRAENYPCRNVPVLKRPSAGTPAEPNGACAEMFPWWNICAEMTNRLLNLIWGQKSCQDKYSEFQNIGISENLKFWKSEIFEKFCPHLNYITL